MRFWLLVVKMRRRLELSIDSPGRRPGETVYLLLDGAKCYVGQNTLPGT
jgi:hypothetical protein